MASCAKLSTLNSCSMSSAIFFGSPEIRRAFRPKGVLELQHHFPLSPSTTSFSPFHSPISGVPSSNFGSYFSKFGFSNSEFVISGRYYSLFLINKALGGLGAFPLGGAGRQNRSADVSSREARFPQGALEGLKGSPREPSSARKGPQGSLRGSKRVPREPKRARKGPGGSL